MKLVCCGRHKILFLIAAEAEYGPHLRALFSPLFIGVGPVEAAISTTATLAALKAADDMPDLVVSLGSAGSATLKQTEIYQVSSVSWRDMDATALGVAKGETPFLGLPAVLSLPCFFDDLPKASLSTGGNLVSGAAYAAIDADMVDMETYAILRACQTFGVPLIGLRGISDGCKELHHAQDWQQYLHIIDEKLGALIAQALSDIAAMPKIAL